MKNLINLSIILFALISFSCFSSCTSDSISSVEHEILNVEKEAETHQHLHDEMHNHVENLGVNLENPEPIDFVLPDGTTENRYLIEGDIALTRSELDQLRDDMNGDLRQYHTNNLVNSPQELTITGYTGNYYALTEKMKTGLTAAVNSFNALNMGITFRLDFAPNVAADIVVYQVNNGKSGGSAGFPSAGKPHKWVQIFNRLQLESPGLIQHVIIHEIGHCLGLRHTDYATRSSCYYSSNEGDGGVGANHIPGTPIQDANSVMKACYNGTETGALTWYDIIAFRHLY